MSNVQKWSYRYSDKTEAWEGREERTITELFLAIREALWYETSTVCLLLAQGFQSSQIFLPSVKVHFSMTKV